MYGEIQRRSEVQRVDARIVTEDELRVMTIEREMFPHLDADQSKRLDDVLRKVLTPPEPYMDNKGYIDAFIEAKAIQGRSRKTLRYYRSEVTAADEAIGKPFEQMTAQDIRSYLMMKSSTCGEKSLNNIRRILSSFFNWMETDDYVNRSVMRKVEKIKEPKRRRKPFTDMEIEMIRTACTDVRDRAMVEFLLSSGVRVSELSGVKRTETDMSSRRAVVIGKGDKEREVMFSETAAFYLKMYLDGRSDDVDSLFVTKTRRNGEYRPISASGIETICRGIGKSAGVKNVHPHRFRHTMATKALQRGMPVEEIKELLGHENIETTLIYADIDHETAMNNARRLIG